MRVLWFSNTPANADEYFKNDSKGSGGWLKALDQLLQNDVELHVAFLKNDHKEFKYKKTTYYPISVKKNIFKKALQRYFGHSESKDIHNYCLELIMRLEPDIVHIHGTENPFTSIIPYSPIPVVVSIQGIITVINHKYCSGLEKKYLRIKNRTAKSLKNLVFPWSFNVQFKSFNHLSKSEKTNLLQVKNIIGRTSWDRSVASILAPNSTYYHNDEILRDSFYNISWTPHNRKKTIIHTTLSNDYYKGFETLCMSLYLLNLNGIDCEWHVAGVSHDDLIVKITKRKLKKEFPNSNLVLAGNLNQNELIESLLNSDIYVMTSHIDNSPNSLCEALMLGMPCISTFVGGIGSLVKQEEDGILIQDGDPWAMSGAIIEMRKNKDRAVHYGKNARKKSLIRHNKSKIVNELCQVYGNVINETKNNDLLKK